MKNQQQIKDQIAIYEEIASIHQENLNHALRYDTKDVIDSLDRKLTMVKIKINELSWVLAE